MPKPGEEEEIEDGLDIEIEDDIEDDGDIEIDLDEDDDVEDVPADNKAWAEMRVENKELKNAVNEMKSKLDSISTQQQSAPVTPIETRTPVDPNDYANWTKAQWDELAKEDWQRAVDLRAEVQAKKVHEKVTTNSEFNRAQAEAQEVVLKRHPELNDLNSEKGKIYANIVTANPDYLKQKKGPVMAMYEMEEYLEKNMGYKREDIVKAETAARQAEQDRGARVALTSTQGRNVSQGNKVTLTKSDREFCDIQGIDPKVFAANKKKLEKAGRGGVQL